MRVQVCPHCGEMIEKGTLRSRGGNYFLPEGEKTPALYTEKAMNMKSAVMLPPDSLSLGTPKWPDAYLCRNCKLIIIPYE